MNNCVCRHISEFYTITHIDISFGGGDHFISLFYVLWTNYVSIVAFFVFNKSDMGRSIWNVFNPQPSVSDYKEVIGEAVGQKVIDGHELFFRKFYPEVLDDKDN